MLCSNIVVLTLAYPSETCFEEVELLETNHLYIHIGLLNGPNITSAGYLETVYLKLKIQSQLLTT